MKKWTLLMAALLLLTSCQQAEERPPEPAAAPAIIRDGILGPITIDEKVQAAIATTGVATEEPKRLPTPDTPHGPYLTEPPTSGAYAELPFGKRNDNLPPEIQVNALRQGKVILHHHTQMPDVVAKVDAIASRYDSVIINAEYESPDRITLTAWGHLYRSDELNPSEIIFFIESFQDSGP